MAGDPCLYIDFYRDRLAEFEPEDQLALAKALGNEPATSVVADVSGRNCGDEQVRSFANMMLAKYAGVAQDDYSEHCWTLAEILSRSEVQGHRFFDYWRAIS